MTYKYTQFNILFFLILLSFISQTYAKSQILTNLQVKQELGRQSEKNVPPRLSFSGNMSYMSLKIGLVAIIAIILICVIIYCIKLFMKPKKANADPESRDHSIAAEPESRAQFIKELKTYSAKSKDSQRVKQINRGLKIVTSKRPSHMQSCSQHERSLQQILNSIIQKLETWGSYAQNVDIVQDLSKYVSECISECETATKQIANSIADAGLDNNALLNLVNARLKKIKQSITYLSHATEKK